MEKVFTCSVVIPVYNSQDSLPLLVKQLIELLPGIASEFEVILVNDGSHDNSWGVIQNLQAWDSHIIGIDLMRNYGQHNALLCGIRQAKFGIIITMDDDLQHPPQEIPKLLSGLDEGYDVIYGTPFTEQHGLWRNLSSRMMKTILQKSMGVEVARNVSAFRGFRSEIRDAFSNYQGTFVSIDVLLTWGTTRFAAKKVDHNPRLTGTSNYTFVKLLTLAFTIITGFSILPLQIASILGFISFIFGLCILLYVLLTYFINGGSLPGFPFLASIIAIFSGVQLFALGIFGEYLGRLFNRSLDKPTYTIRSQVSGGETNHHDHNKMRG